MARIFSEFIDFSQEERETRGPLDLNRFLERVDNRFGTSSLSFALEFVELLILRINLSPYSVVKSKYVDHITPLEDLFKRESLDSYYGGFFDQRYIDYLSRNFDEISQINWRQFEGLTAEYFQRMGFEVALGPGRNDGGVDIRVWPDRTSRNKPPSIIIQCKRTKKMVQRVVVKALYADLLQENAESGLIVTTSRLSPGAKEDIEIRSYPILEVDRKTLLQWIEAMRTPGAGLFLV